MACLLVAGVLCILPSAKVMAETEGDYEYEELTDGTVAITKYKGIETEVVIPDKLGGKSVTGIGEWAFDFRREITSIMIPNSVTNIGESAFRMCSGLTNITIPDSVTSIGVAAFEDCSGLTSITIPESVTIIGASAFYGCSGLTDITIPDGVTSIDAAAFKDCSGLTSITIPDSVTSIGFSAFDRCSGLTSITIPDSVTIIDADAFMDCSGLTSITIPESVTRIGDRAFDGCSGLTSITIPAGVTSIGDGAFNGCSNLTEIKVDTENTVYNDGNGSNALIETASKTLIRGCSKTIIPDSVISIGWSAFSECRGLKSITIPNSVTSISDCAFEDCSELTSITIPSNVTNMGEFTFGETICSKDLVIHVEKGSYAEKWAKEYGIKAEVTATKTNPDDTSEEKIINTDSKDDKSDQNSNSKTPATKGAILEYPAEKCKVKVISDDVNDPRVSYYSVTDKKATKITIPDTVLIDDVKYRVTDVGNKAFYGNKKVKSITGGGNLITIGNKAFMKCTKLKSVTINSVDLGTIGANAFNGDKSLKKLKLKTANLTKKSVGKSAFKGTDKKLLVKVPKSMVKKYKKFFKAKGNKMVKVK